MANFMCQLVWATVLRYLVKHCSGCNCEYVLGVRLRFKSVDLVNQVALHNVGEPHPTSWRSWWSKDPSWARRNSAERQPFRLNYNTDYSLGFYPEADFGQVTTAIVWANSWNKSLDLSPFYAGSASLAKPNIVTEDEWMKLRQAEENGDYELVIISIFYVAGRVLQEIICLETDDHRNIHLHTAGHEEQKVQTVS